MEKERHRGTSRLQFSKEEQMQAVRAGQPERSHSPLLHQGIHAAHAQLHHQAAEANEDENSAVQAALTADDMQEEAFRAAAHAGKAPKRYDARRQQKRAIRQEYAAAKSSRSPANHIAPAPKVAANAVPKAENIKKRLRQTFARHPTAWAVLALAALLLAVMSSLQSCTPLAQSVLESIVIGTYPAEEADVKAAESAYASMERQLKEEMSNYARNHPEYDEVQVDADEIWHDPYVLMAIISACFDGQDWTLETAMPVLDKYFKLQYIVTESVKRNTIPHGDRAAVQPGNRTHGDGDGSRAVCLYSLSCAAGEQKSVAPARCQHEPSYHGHVRAVYGNPRQYGGHFPRQSLRCPAQRPHAVRHSRRDARKQPDFRALMAEAEKYIGYPYVWGGASPETSFDCSGFVSYVFTNSGVYNTGRLGAKGLRSLCRNVPAAQAEPGDVVFFEGTMGDGVDGITHCGIYVGNDIMIHCGSVRPEGRK